MPLLYPNLKDDQNKLKDLLEKPLTNFNNHSTLLKDLQPSILLSRSKDRPIILLAFLSFKTKNTIKNITEIANKIAEYSNTYLASELDQYKFLKAKQEGKNPKLKLLRTIYLSHTGYEFLKIRNNLRPYQDKHNDSFIDGISSLNNFPKKKDIGKDYHLLIRIAFPNTKTINKEKTVIEETFNGFINSPPYYVQANGKDSLGFKDGISNPQFFRKNHKDNSPLDTVLIPDPGGQNWDSCGSFMSYLKIKINKKSFEKNTDEIAKNLIPPNNELAEALLMGRFRDGTPLTIIDSPDDNPTNGFNYNNDKKGLKCPFHTHIRKANPRNSEDPIKIVRRGASFKNSINDSGVLFMSYQRDLEKQFEFIYNNWLNSSSLGSTVDPITSVRKLSINVPETWGKTNLSTPIKLKPIVEYIEGGYFFAPSISFLQCLAKHGNKKQP